MDESGLIAHATWPIHDEALCIDDLISIVVQINGKKRDELYVPKDTEKDELERLALASEKAQKYFEGREPKRVIVVPGRLVNIVI